MTSHESLDKLELLRNYDLLKVFKLRTRSYITSLIGRELAYRFSNSVVVLLHIVEKLDCKYIYVRSMRYGLRSVLSEIKAHGLTVGGKDKVLVVTVHDEVAELSKVITHLLRYLRGKGS